MARPPDPISSRTYACPENVDLVQLVAQHPPQFRGKSKYRHDRALKVLDALYRASVKNKVRSDDEFIPVPSAFLQRRISDYEQYTTWLVQADVLEIDPSYWNGDGSGFSKGYRFTPAYRTPIRMVRAPGAIVLPPSSPVLVCSGVDDEEDPEAGEPFDFAAFFGLPSPSEAAPDQRTDRSSSRGIYKASSLSSLSFAPPSSLFSYYLRKTDPATPQQVKRETFARLCEVLERVTVRADAVESIQQQVEESAILRNGKALYLMDFVERQVRVSVSRTTGRLYSPITQMRRDARPFLLLDGSDDLAMVDVKTCHPYLLIHVAQQVRAVAPKVISRKQIENWEYFVLEDDLYDFFTLAYFRATAGYLNRGRVKERVQRVFNGSVRKARGSRRDVFRWVFRTMFPGPMRVINWVKQHPDRDYTRLANVLQQLEAEVMLWRVCPQLFREGITPLTIHDGVIVPSESASRTAEVVKYEFERLVGVPPNVAIKPLKDDASGRRVPPDYLRDIVAMFEDEEDAA